MASYAPFTPSASPVKTSVLTLVRGRQAQLDNFVRALCRQTDPAFELVIASMQSEPPAVENDLPFPVRVVTVGGDSLPLAQARNSAAEAARGELLIFLDVDCIAAPGLVAHYARMLSCHDLCLMGDVRYLPADAPVSECDYPVLQRLAIRHPARPVLCGNELRHEDNPRALWGLSFALRRRRFFEANGFNADFCGYGGEETDFAMRLALIDTRFAWAAGARSLHQWHPISRPPLEHFSAIIANAQRFHAAWGSWCLEYWLEAFVQMRLIEWSIDARRISLLREPTSHELAHAFDEGSSKVF